MSEQIDLSGLFKEFRSAVERMSDKRVMSEIGEILVSSVQLNFQQHGRYGSTEGFGGSNQWEPVSHWYGEYKKSQGKDPKNVLLYTGQLRSSITYRVAGSTVYVGTNKIYAEDLNNGKGIMPARPFLVVQDEDIEDIADAIEFAVSKG